MSSYLCYVRRPQSVSVLLIPFVYLLMLLKHAMFDVQVINCLLFLFILGGCKGGAVGFSTPQGKEYIVLVGDRLFKRG